MEMFLVAFFAISVITSLVVEGIKVLLGDRAYSANTLAAVVSVLVSVVSAVCYTVDNCVPLDEKNIVIYFLLCVGSWLCSMLGYDKVKQAILQIKEQRK